MTTKFLATQARDEAPHYQHSNIGYNYRMSNVCIYWIRTNKALKDRVNESVILMTTIRKLAHIPFISFLEEENL